MGRRPQVKEQREKLLPVIAEAFGELGYRRATTATLAKRCRVRENILYRLWKDKKEMFIASLGNLFNRRKDDLEKAIKRSPGRGTRAEKMAAHVAQHYGDDSLARVIFAALAETDDRDIRGTLYQMYRNYQAFVEGEIRSHRGRKNSSAPDIDLSAAAIIGLATALNIYTEIGVIPSKDRKTFYRRAFSGITPLLLGDAGR